MSARPRRFPIRLLVILTLFVGLGYLCSAYGGMVNPLVTAVPAVLAMTFPFWLLALAITFILSLLFRSRLSLIISLVAFIAGWGGLTTFCPLNFSDTDDLTANDSTGSSFTILTYNLLELNAFNGQYPDETNLTVQAIIDANPDIVAMQEAPPMPSVGYRFTSPAQRDSLIKRYPYRLNAAGIGLLSRFPARLAPVPEPSPDNGSFHFRHYHIDLPDGSVLSLYNVHLESFGLSDDDKRLYRKLTNGEVRHRIMKARRFLISKLASAFRSHAEQSMQLSRCIEADTCASIIVCGDFNDIPGSYAIRALSRHAGLSDAYVDAGFGATPTYHVNRFYFHIDQILYRGDISPMRVVRLPEGASDHYPVMARFSINSDL